MLLSFHYFPVCGTLDETLKLMFDAVLTMLVHKVVGIKPYVLIVIF